MTSPSELPREPRKAAALIGVHAYPDPAVGSRRISELARHLCEHGWQVDLIAQAGPFPRSGGQLAQGVQRHDIEFPEPLSRPLLRLLRRGKRAERDPEPAQAACQSTEAAAPLPSSVPSSLAARLIDWARFHYFRVTVSVDKYKRWGLHAARRLWTLTRSHRPAAIFASGPPFSPLASAALVARLRRVPFIMDMRDPWLNCNDVLPRDYPGFRRYVDAMLERLCVKLAAHVVTTSQRLTQQLQKRYPKHASKIVTIRNGYEDDMLMEPPRHSGHLAMLYAGTIYLNRNPLPFFEALLNLRGSGRIDPRRIRVLFVGHCNRWENLDLRQWLRERQLDEIVSLRDPVPAAQVAELIREANVLINFAQKQHDSVPAKLFEQIASRRHVLLFTEADSESANVAGDFAQVLRVDSDIAEIETAICRLYAQWVDGDTPPAMDDSQLASLARRRANEHLERLLESKHPAP